MKWSDDFVFGVQLFNPKSEITEKKSNEDGKPYSNWNGTFLADEITHNIL
jgi:hypothetical protein